MTFSVNHLSIGLFLTLALSRCITARLAYGSFYSGMDIPQYFLDETETMDEAMYSDMKNYPENNPNFLSNWPWLRELLPPNDIEDDASNSEDKSEKVVVPEAIPTPLPLKKNPSEKNLLKDHGTKKNIHSRRRLYMSPCHFKICNMGRKRNARHVRY